MSGPVGEVLLAAIRAAAEAAAAPTLKRLVTQPVNKHGCPRQLPPARHGSRGGAGGVTSPRSQLGRRSLEMPFSRNP